MVTLEAIILSSGRKKKFVSIFKIIQMVRFFFFVNLPNRQKWVSRGWRSILKVWTEVLLTMQTTTRLSHQRKLALAAILNVTKPWTCLTNSDIEINAFRSEKNEDELFFLSFDYIKNSSAWYMPIYWLLTLLNQKLLLLYIHSEG